MCEGLTKHHHRRLRHYFRLGGSRATQVSELDGIALDLVGKGLAETKSTAFGYTSIMLTPKGQEVAYAKRQSDIAARSVHHDLGARLAAWLRNQGRITWENVEFKNKNIKKDRLNNGKEVEYVSWECIRPDVFTIKPSLQLKYANPCIYEVKVSRADFLGDIARPEKRQAYLKMAEAVYYVAKEGLIDADEVPQGFGLMVEKEDGKFVLSKKAKRHKVVLDDHHYLNMIIKPGQYPDGFGEL